jgi:hypothetical protein
MAEYRNRRAGRRLTESGAGMRPAIGLNVARRMARVELTPFVIHA